MNARIIKKLAKKLLYGAKAESETYIDYLRSMGMEIGEDVTIYDMRRKKHRSTLPGPG